MGALGATALAAQGASIGINLGSGRTDASLGAGDVAGVVPQGNWNNAAGNNGSLAVLNTDAGTASGASVTWATDEQWSVGTGPADANGTLLNGFVSENNNDGSQISITGIPFTVYDLYVYVSHDRAGEDVILGETNNLFADFTAIESDTDITSPVSFVQQTTSGTGSGNFVVFSGLTAANLELTMGAIDANSPGGTIDRNAIAAVQIVQVPEPSSSVLAALAALGLIGRRRR